MNYGLYLSASGVLTNLARMDVISNNLANVQTPGYRPDHFAAMTRLPERLEDPAQAAMLQADPQQLLEQLGGGVLAQPMRLSRTGGPIEVTGRELDVAIKGEGFFAVGVAGGANGARNSETMRYTRDGRFTLDADGALITVNGAHRVLDDTGKAIELDRKEAAVVQQDGSIMQGGITVAKLGVAMIDVDQVEKLGEGLFASSAKPDFKSWTGAIAPQALEGSGVDPVLTMTEMMETSRNISSGSKLMQYHDQLMNQAINRLGRIA